MAVAVTDIGTADSFIAATVTIASVTVPVGASIVVCVTEGGNSGGLGGSVTDGTNTYTAVVGANYNNDTTQGFSRIFVKDNAAAISNATITYTKKNNNANTCISAFYVTGTGGIDTAVTASATGNSSTPSVTGGAPTGANEAIVGWVGGNFGLALTQDSTNGAYAAPPDLNENQNSAHSIGGNIIYTGTSARTYAPTTAAGAVWAALMVAFKVPSGASGTVAQVAALIAAIATPAWPYAFIGGQQPYAPRTLNPAITAVPANEPPYQHRERTVQQQAIAAQAAQPPTWPYPFQGGWQPYQGGRIPAAVAGQTVNNPPFGVPPDWIVNVVQAWQPDTWPPVFIGGRQAYEPRKLNPAITAVPEDNPPFRHPELLQSTRSVTQSWQPDIWPFWFTGGRQPYSARQLDGHTIGVPQDDPPFSHPSRATWMPSITWQWQPDPWPPPWPFVFMGGRQAYAPARLHPSITDVPVNNPPFSHPARSPGMPAVTFSWQPDIWPQVFMGGRQAYDPRRLPPPALGVPAENPPFQHPGRWAGLVSIERQWLPPDWPVVFSGALQPYAPARLPPFVTDVEVDDPPFVNRGRLSQNYAGTVVAQWQPDPWPPVFLGGKQAYEARKLSPGIPGQSINEPPYGIPNPSTLRVILDQWKPDPWPPVFMGAREAYEGRKLSPGVPGQSINDPPFRHPSRLPGMPAVVAQWQPPVWPYLFMGERQPYEGIKYALGVPGLSVDNPPFTHRMRTASMPTIIYQWQPPVWPYEFIGSWGPYKPRQLNPSITNVFPTPDPRWTMANIVVRVRYLS